MKKIIISLVSTILAFLLFIGVSYIYLYVGNDINEETATSLQSIGDESVQLNTRYTMLSFNIGFLSYGTDFSYYGDKGEYTRAQSINNINNNLKGTVDLINFVNPDFVLLQEVDEEASRTYSVNEVQKLKDNFSKMSTAFTINIDSPYYYLPLSNPVGKIRSGLLTLSKYTISKAKASILENRNLNKKPYDMDSCFSVTEYKINNGDTLYIYNVYINPFNKESEKLDEDVQRLLNHMSNAYSEGKKVICGGTFNRNLVNSKKIILTSNVNIIPIDQNIIPKGLKLYFDSETSTARDPSIPFTKDSETYICDGFICSEDISVVNVETKDISFVHSDHNPAVLSFIITNYE